MQGTLEVLSRQEMATWKGWVIFYWNMYHGCMLFNQKPAEEIDEPFLRFDTSNANENVSPYFLRACGIDVKFDTKSRNFYYGNVPGRNLKLRSYHPPIEIELHLPKVLLEQLGLI